LDERRSGQLAVVPLAEPEWERAVGAVYRSDRALSTAARKFVELLQRHGAPGDGDGGEGVAARKTKKAGGEA
jgi:DNA-binding transcriptional LysR family regulator